jgi:hypothetical protein
LRFARVDSSAARFAAFVELELELDESLDDEEVGVVAVVLEDTGVVVVVVASVSKAVS